jgi:hypothetical protein
VSVRPSWLYPKSPVKFGAKARALAFARLLGFVGLVLAALALGSVAFRNLLDSDGSGDGSSGATPTTVIDGLSVPFMQPADCDEAGSSDDDESPSACDADSIQVGADLYVLHDDPVLEVISANVSDTLFAAGEVGSPDSETELEVAYIVENVDPAVLLAGQSGDRFVAITGPSIESTTAEPTLDVMFVVCVSLVEAEDYEQCRVLAEPVVDDPDGG